MACLCLGGRHGLSREEGIFAGTSTGLNVLAALRLAREIGSGGVVVPTACDRGFKYLDGETSGRPLGYDPLGLSQFEIRSRTLEFELSGTPDGRPVHFENFLLNFGSRQLGEARVGIQSFQFEFPGGDHNIQSISLRFDRPEIVYSNTSAVWGVRLSVWAGIRDHGNYDDHFRGRVSVVVFAR